MEGRRTYEQRAEGADALGQIRRSLCANRHGCSDAGRQCGGDGEDIDEAGEVKDGSVMELHDEEVDLVGGLGEFANQRRDLDDVAEATELDP